MQITHTQILLTVLTFTFFSPTHLNFLTSPTKGRNYFQNIAVNYYRSQQEFDNDLSKVYKIYVDVFTEYLYKHLTKIIIVDNRFTIPGARLPAILRKASTQHLSDLVITFINLKTDKRHGLHSPLTWQEMNLFESIRFRQIIQKLDPDGELFQSLGFILDITEVLWSMENHLREQKRYDDASAFKDIFLGDPSFNPYLVTEEGYNFGLSHLSWKFYDTRKQENSLFEFHLKDKMDILRHFLRALRKLNIKFKHCNVSPNTLSFKQISKAEVENRKSQSSTTHKPLINVRFGNDYFRAFLTGFEHMRPKSEPCFGSSKATRELEFDLSMNGQIELDDIFMLGWTLLLSEYEMWVGESLYFIFSDINTHFMNGKSYPVILKQYIYKQMSIRRMFKMLRDIETFRNDFLNKVYEMVGIECGDFTFIEIKENLFESPDLKTAKSVFLIGLRQLIIYEVMDQIEQDKKVRMDYLSKELQNTKNEVTYSIYVDTQENIARRMKSRMLDNLKKLVRLKFDRARQYMTVFKILEGMTTIEFSLRMKDIEAESLAAKMIKIMDSTELQNYNRIVSMDDYKFSTYEVASPEFYQAFKKQVVEFRLI